MKKVVIYTDGACSGNPGPRRMGSYTNVWRYEKRNIWWNEENNK